MPPSTSWKQEFPNPNQESFIQFCNLKVTDVLCRWTGRNVKPFMFIPSHISFLSTLKKKKKKEHLPLSQPHLPEVTIREHQWFIPQPHSSPPIPSTLLAPLKTYGWKMFCFGNILYTLLLPISQSKEIKIWLYLGAVIYANLASFLASW